MNISQIEFLGDGLSQNERIIPALLPANMKIDERSIFDLAKLVYKIGSQFNFYNFNNEIDGDWQGFFKNDAHVLSGLLDGFNEKNTLKNYKKLKENIINSHDFDELKTAVNEIVRNLYSFSEFLIEIAEFYSRSNLHDENIVENIEENHQSLCRFYYDAIGILGEKSEIEFEDKYLVGIKINYPDTNKGAETDLRVLKNSISDLLNELDVILSNEISFNYYFKQKYNSAVSNDGNMEPHISLIITFLHLYSHLQKQINGITKKHLDYYYYQILQLTPRPAHPDSTYLLLELANGVDELLVKTGTTFIAKPGGNPPAIEYFTKKDFVINRAIIKELKTVFIENTTPNSKQHQLDTIIYKSDNPLNDVKSIIKNPDTVPHWSIFGESQRDLSRADATMHYALSGFVISSPLLYQPEGNRDLTILIYFKNQPGSITDGSKQFRVDESSFALNFTGEKSWSIIETHSTRWILKDRCIELKFSLSEEDESIVPFNHALHVGNYSLDYPAIRIVLNNFATYKVYSYLKGLEIDKITINVDVKDYKICKLQNSLGAVNAATPFQIFGPIPLLGSYLDIKDTNVFNKYTTKFKVNIDWLDLPHQPGGLTDYYKEYGVNITNESFLVMVGSVINGKYTSKVNDLDKFHLFKTNYEQKLNDSSYIEVEKLRNMEFGNDMKLIGELADVDFINGAIRIELVSPPDGFGHRIFPQVFSDAAMYNAGLKLIKVNKRLPNMPYIPMVKKLAISYSLSQTEIFKTSNSASEMQLIHLYPFGHNIGYPQKRSNFYLLPQIEFASTLFIGLDQVEAGEEVSILFKFSDSNIYNINFNSEKINWQYLVNNEWKTVPVNNITQDTTNDLTCTGIINIVLPTNISKNNTILNPDLFWLQAGANTLAGMKLKVISIHTQVVVVERSKIDVPVDDNDGYKIPYNSISALSIKNPKIQNIWQPYPSFEGRKEQLIDDLYIASSERLRHKNRPVLVMDILQVVLEEFPEILTAKCINAIDNKYVKAGVNLYIIVIPKRIGLSASKNEQIYVEIPKLIEIKKSLQKRITPFIRVDVGNAFYEKIKVVCSVCFQARQIKSENAFFSKKLNEEINQYIAPWLTDINSVLKIGSEINILGFLNFIKTRSYVSYVTGFSIVHMYSIYDNATSTYINKVVDSTSIRDGYIRAYLPESVFIPADNHLITVLEKAEILNQNNAGIQTLKIGGELVIGGAGVGPAETNPPAQDEDDEFYEFTFNF